jgi:hypothetical protein
MQFGRIHGVTLDVLAAILLATQAVFYVTTNPVAIILSIRISSPRCTRLYYEAATRRTGGRQVGTDRCAARATTKSPL